MKSSLRKFLYGFADACSMASGGIVYITADAVVFKFVGVVAVLSALNRFVRQGEGR